MTDRQLRKLKREELLRIMIQQSREIERLGTELEEAKRQLESRELVFDRCGSIAEAALAVSHVFEDAQEAAALYIENIRRMEQQQKAGEENG